MNKILIFILLLSPIGLKANIANSALQGSFVIAEKHKKPKRVVRVYTNIIINKWKKYKHIPNPYIPIALAWSESGFNPKARSKAGCRGIFQLETRTAIYICKKYGIRYNRKTIKKDLINNVYFNIEVGLAALNEEFKAADGNMKKAILSYKCGRGTIDRALFITSRQNELYNRYASLLKSFS